MTGRKGKKRKQKCQELLLHQPTREEWDQQRKAERQAEYRTRKNQAAADAKTERDEFRKDYDPNNPDDVKKLQELEKNLAEKESKTNAGYLAAYRARKKETAEAATEETVAYIINSPESDLQNDPHFLDLKTEAIKANANVRRNTEKLLDAAAVMKTVVIKTGESDRNAETTVDLYNECIKSNDNKDKYKDFWKQLEKLHIA